MKVYNKLVRDKIPQVIKSKGGECKTEILDNERYLTELNKKLLEETNEYIESEDVMEVCDMLEVIYAIIAAKGYSLEQVDELRQKKVNERGAFNDKIFLISTND